MQKYIDTTGEARLLYRTAQSEKEPTVKKSWSDTIVATVQGSLDDAEKALPSVLHTITHLKEHEQWKVLDDAKKSLAALPEKVRAVITQNLQELEVRVATQVTGQELACLRTLMPSGAEAGAQGLGSALWQRLSEKVNDAGVWAKQNPDIAIAIAATATIGAYPLYRLVKWGFGRVKRLFGGGAEEAGSASHASGWKWYHWIPVVGLGMWGIQHATGWLRNNMDIVERVGGMMGKSIEGITQRGKEAADPYVKKGKELLGQATNHVEELQQEGTDLIHGAYVRYGLKDQETFQRAEDAYLHDEDGVVRQCFGLSVSGTSPQYEAFTTEMKEKHTSIELNGVNYVRGDTALNNYRQETLDALTEVGEAFKQWGPYLVGIAALGTTYDVNVIGGIVSAIKLGTKPLRVGISEIADIIMALARHTKNHPILMSIAGVFGAAGSLFLLLEGKHFLRTHKLPQNFTEFTKAAQAQLMVTPAGEALRETETKLLNIGQTLSDAANGLKEWVLDALAEVETFMLEVAPDALALDLREQALVRNNYGFSHLKQTLQLRYNEVQRTTGLSYTLRDAKQAQEALETFESAFIDHRSASTDEDPAPIQAYDTLVPLLAKLKIQLVEKNGIMTWEEDGEERHLCIDPHITDAATFIERSISMKQGREGDGEYVAFRALQELRLMAGNTIDGKDWLAPDWIPGDKWIVIAVGGMLYWLSPHNTGEFFSAPRELVSGILDADTSWSEWVADYVVAGMHATVMLTSIGIARRFNNFVMGSGRVLPMTARNALGALATKFRPITGPALALESAASTYANNSLALFLGRQQAEFYQRNTRLFCSMLEDAGIRPQWIGIVDEAKDVSMMKIIAHRLGASNAIVGKDPAAMGKELHSIIKERLKTAAGHSSGGIKLGEDGLDDLLKKTVEWQRIRGRGQAMRIVQHTENAAHIVGHPLSTAKYYGWNPIAKKAGEWKARAINSAPQSLRNAYQSVHSSASNLLAQRHQILATAKQYGLNLKNSLSNAQWKQLSSATPADYMAMSRLSKCLLALGVVADAGAVVNGYFQWKESNALQENATSEEMREIYSHRKVFASANFVVGTTGLITGGAGILSSFGVGGTAVASVASTPVTAAMLPIALMMEAGYASHIWSEELAKSPEERLAQHELPSDVLAALREKPTQEMIGQVIPFLKRNPDLLTMSPLSIALRDIGLITSPVTQGEVSQNRAVADARIAALGLMVGNIAIPTMMRDPATGTDRPPTEDEKKEILMALDAYKGAFVTAVRREAKGTPLEPLSMTADMAHILRSAMIEAKLAHDRHVEKKAALRCDPDEIPASLLPDASLSKDEQVKAYVAHQRYQSLAMATAEYHGLSRNPEMLRGTIAGMLEEEQQFGLIALESRLSITTNFVDWWPDSLTPDAWLLSADRASIVRSALLQESKKVLEKATTSIVETIVRLPDPSKTPDTASATLFRTGIDRATAEYTKAVERVDAILSRDPEVTWRSLSSDHLQAAEVSVTDAKRLAVVEAQIPAIQAKTTTSRRHVDFLSPDATRNRMRLMALQGERVEKGGRIDSQNPEIFEQLSTLLPGRKAVSEMKKELRDAFLIEEFPDMNALRLAPRAWQLGTGSLLIFFNPDTHAWEWVQNGDPIDAPLPASLFRDRKPEAYTMGTSIEQLPEQQGLSDEQFAIIQRLFLRMRASKDGTGKKAA